ncbi:MAG: hypothetical protein ACRDZ6_04910 [Acidimicrobiales bacterium]
MKRAEFAAVLGEDFEETEERYVSPDGPVDAITYGMLGSGQWA